MQEASAVEDPALFKCPNPVHSHYITAAHGTNWASAFSILRESMIRPQAAKGGITPLWLFRQGVDRKHSHNQGIGRMRQKKQSRGQRSCCW